MAALNGTETIYVRTSTKHRIRGLLVTRVAPLTFRACNSPKVFKVFSHFSDAGGFAVHLFMSVRAFTQIKSCSHDIGETVLKVTIYTNNPNPVICTLYVSCGDAKFSGLECCTNYVR